jgi:hypothetical protein
VGKASRRKNQRRRGIGPSRADAEERRSRPTLLTGLQNMIHRVRAEQEREEQAKRTWTGDIEPPRAALGRWRADSVGDRFFSAADMTDAAIAPRLADAALPSPEQLAENPGHWATAVSALVRAVVLESTPVHDPVVTQVLDLLTPVVRAELATADDDRDFPGPHGPLFLLGASVLGDATWAIVGLDPLDQSLARIERAVDEAAAAAGRPGPPAGKLMAEALIRCFAEQYDCTEPRDDRTLQRLGRTNSGNPLIDLIQARDLAPEDALCLGLITLAALAGLARTDAGSAAGRQDSTGDPGEPAGAGPGAGGG